MKKYDREDHSDTMLPKTFPSCTMKSKEVILAIEDMLHQGFSILYYLSKKKTLTTSPNKTTYHKDLAVMKLTIFAAFYNFI